MRLDTTKIRVEMAKRNINQKELANLAGIQTATISKIMNGKSKGEIQTWEKISKALNKSLLEIVEN